MCRILNIVNCVPSHNSVGLILISGVKSIVDSSRGVPTLFQEYTPDRYLSAASGLPACTVTKFKCSFCFTIATFPHNFSRT